MTDIAMGKITTVEALLSVYEYLTLNTHLSFYFLHPE
jgi:hypothetical protein